MKRLLLLSLLLASPADPATRGQVLTVEATAYCLCRKCCGPGAKGETYTGRRASGPGLAVSRRKGQRVVPLGARVQILSRHPLIPRYAGRTVRVDDVGGGVRAGSVDIRVKTHAQAVAWGRRQVRVRIIDRR